MDNTNVNLDNPQVLQSEVMRTVKDITEHFNKTRKGPWDGPRDPNHGKRVLHIALRLDEFSLNDFLLEIPKLQQLFDYFHKLRTVERRQYEEAQAHASVIRSATRLPDGSPVS